MRRPSPAPLDSLIKASGPLADVKSDAPALSHAAALRWWFRVRAQLATAKRCAPGGHCPDCREGTGCPIDLIYQTVGLLHG
jgi:hypothetical protein